MKQKEPRSESRPNNPVELFSERQNTTEGSGSAEDPPLPPSSSSSGRMETKDEHSATICCILKHFVPIQIPIETVFKRAFIFFCSIYINPFQQSDQNKTKKSSLYLLDNWSEIPGLWVGTSSGNVVSDSVQCSFVKLNWISAPGGLFSMHFNGNLACDFESQT